MLEGLGGHGGRGVVVTARGVRFVVVVDASQEDTMVWDG